MLLKYSIISSAFLVEVWNILLVERIRSDTFSKHKFSVVFEQRVISFVRPKLLLLLMRYFFRFLILRKYPFNVCGVDFGTCIQLLILLEKRTAFSTLLFFAGLSVSLISTFLFDLIVCEATALIVEQVKKGHRCEKVCGAAKKHGKPMVKKAVSKSRA